MDDHYRQSVDFGSDQTPPDMEPGFNGVFAEEHQHITLNEPKSRDSVLLGLSRTRSSGGGMFAIPLRSRAEVDAVLGVINRVADRVFPKPVDTGTQVFSGAAPPPAFEPILP